jgi:3-methyladenine DNA glycosylase AlkD
MPDPSQNKDQQAAAILDRLHALADPEAAAGMARFGIRPGQALGISIPTLRKLGKEIGPDHTLALALWRTGIHEARILSAYLAVPKQVTERLMETWVADFDSWDVCDQVCSNLFDRTPFAYQKALAWSLREEEFVKRAGFVLMATLSVHDKSAADNQFIQFFEPICREAGDPRNFVKKAVNWALRQIGKRNPRLNRLAIETAQAIQELGSAPARWIASDALRELTSDKVQARLTR